MSYRNSYIRATEQEEEEEETSMATSKTSGSSQDNKVLKEQVEKLKESLAAERIKNSDANREWITTFGTLAPGQCRYNAFYIYIQLCRANSVCCSVYEQACSIVLCGCLLCCEFCLWFWRLRRRLCGVCVPFWYGFGSVCWHCSNIDCIIMDVHKTILVHCISMGWSSCV